MGLSQVVLFSSQDVPIQGEHSSAGPHGQDTKNEVCETVMESARRNMWRSSERGDFPLSFTGLIQVYSNRTTTSLKFNALVAYSAHVVRLTFTKRERRYTAGHGSTLLASLPAGAAELRDRDRKQ